ncbi:MAG: type IV secretory system conjugative DNA transfer family protein [Pseudomonadota bacterium]
MRKLFFLIMRVKFFLVLFFLGSLSGCVLPNPGVYGGTENLHELLHITNVTMEKGGKKVQISPIRLAMLKDTALSLGARAGLAYEAKKMDNMMLSREKTLDAAYDFYGLLLDHDVLPPVLVEGDDTLNLASPNAIRLAQKVYKIERQARFVTAPPTWRDYLWMNFKQPKLPDKGLLPKNRPEREVWNYFVEKGWYQGIVQANNIYQENVNRLNRDYKGMILYRKLYTENMVSAPFVAKTDLGITGNGSHMRIGDKVLRITALPQLNLKGNTWKPAIIPSSIKNGQGKQSSNNQAGRSKFN